MKFIGILPQALGGDSAARFRAARKRQHLRAGLALFLALSGCVDRGRGTSNLSSNPPNQAQATQPKSPVRLSLDPPPIPEPFPVLHGGDFTGVAAPESPDPLVAYRWQQPKATDEPQLYVLRPVGVAATPTAAFDNLAAATAAKGAITVRGTGSLRFDFGVESAAWLEFDSPDLNGSVEASISEYNEPAIVNVGAQTPVKTMPLVKHGHTYRLELNKELYEGVRFGWIHVRTFGQPWHITDVRAVCQIKPANYDGNFACSDPLLTRIWYTGAYVVKVNLLKDYFGAILMERSDRFSWTGDAHTSQAAALVAFGNRDFVKLNLDRTARVSNGIESYSLYWILSLLDYFKYSGDAAALGQHLDNVQAKLAHANAIFTNPPISFYGHDERLGACFEQPDRPETKNAFRLLFLRTCREFAWAMRQQGRADLASHYEQIFEQRLSELHREPAWLAEFGLHAAAEAVDAGATTPAENERLFAREFADPVNRLSYSPFNEYFVIRAMARMNRFDEALAAVRDEWGGQIEYGGTTFFEVYRPSWNQALGKNDPVPNCQVGYTSLAHPWGAGVTKWLSEEILGIKPTAPGFAAVEIAPHLGRNLTWVEGTVPTPRGPVSARFDLKSGDTRVQIPPGTVARVGIPKAARVIQSVSLNGQTVWDGRFHPTATLRAATEDQDFIWLNGCEPGNYAFSVQYQGRPEPFVDVPIVYPARFVAQDTRTGGNWGGTYGRDGCVLFSYEAPGTNRMRLPDYIQSVTTRRGTGRQWKPAVDDPRVPAADASNGGRRTAAALFTGDPEPCKQSIVLDVALKSPREYQFALYFLDFDRRGRRMAVELFDLDTLKMIAPVKVFSDLDGGTYAVYSCRQSVRIRANQVRGENAALSAIFFDPANSESPRPGRGNLSSKGF